MFHHLVYQQQKYAKNNHGKLQTANDLNIRVLARISCCVSVAVFPGVSKCYTDIPQRQDSLAQRQLHVSENLNLLAATL
jgi:hypothetical protein